MTSTDRLRGTLPVMPASEAIEHIPADAVLATSGFGSVGYPKAVPIALSRDERTRSLTVITGGSVGEEIDTTLVESGAVARRFPYLGTKTARTAANTERIAFHDRHISHLSDEVQFLHLGQVDVAVVEAIAVGEDWLIPSTSIGQSPAYVKAAESLIVELNRSHPLQLQEVHDVYSRNDPPNRGPIPLRDPTGRIGNNRIRFMPDKLVAVVETNSRDSAYELRDPTETDTAIAEHFGDFLSNEVRRHPTMSESVRIQFGVGSLGNALASNIADTELGGRELVYYGEVIQDGILDLLDAGALAGASATSLALTAEGYDRFLSNIEEYAKNIVLRPSDLSNSAELIDRFGVVAVNSALEVDLYGHLNSTHVNGTHVIYGVGGSGDFNRNAMITVVVLPSTADNGTISRIVPMVPHVDHTEHDIDVVVTEQGVADLRACSPRERAEKVITVAHPEFQDDLREYLERGRRNGGHMPHDLETALNWPQERQQEER